MNDDTMTRDVNYLLSRAISYHDSYQTLRDRLCAIVLSKKINIKNPLLEFQWRVESQQTDHRALTIVLRRYRTKTDV